MAWGGGPGGVEIMGSEGRLLLFYGDFGTAPFKPAEQLHIYRGYERIPIKLEVGPRPGMRPFWRNFVESVANNTEPLAPGEQGCATLEAVVGAYASAARQRTI